MTFAEFIITVVSSGLAVVARMRNRRWRRGDILQADFTVNVFNWLMVALEHRWRPRFTRCSGKSACPGIDSTTKLRHREWLR